MPSHGQAAVGMTPNVERHYIMWYRRSRHWSATAGRAASVCLPWLLAGLLTLSVLPEAVMVPLSLIVCCCTVIQPPQGKEPQN